MVPEIARTVEDVPVEIRERRLLALQEQVLGSHFANRRITNLRLVYLTKDKNGEIKPWINFPLEIEDKYLGYKINLFFDNLIEDDKNGNADKLANGYCYFEDLSFNIEPSLEVKRLAVYNGSFLHMSRSLLEGRLAEEGFSLYEDDKKLKQRKRIALRKKQKLDGKDIKLDIDSIGTMIKMPPSIEVQFIDNNAKSATSRIHYTDPNLRVTDYGIALPVKGWKITGRMTEDGMLPKLPIDYRPPDSY
jgi:hypothetical protein